MFFGGESIKAEMLSRGFVKLNKSEKDLLEIESKAKSEKIGIWSDLKVSLKQINESVAKKEYDKITTPITKRCYIQRIEGLKLFLIDVVNCEELIWYMSELKIPRMNGLDPRKAFVMTEDYMKDILGKSILRCEVKGCEIYKGEVSLFGTIFSGSRNLSE